MTYEYRPAYTIVHSTNTARPEHGFLFGGRYQIGLWSLDKASLERVCSVISRELEEGYYTVEWNRFTTGVEVNA